MRVPVVKVMRCLNTNVRVMMSCRSFACVLAVTLGLAILSDPGTYGVKAKHIVGGTRSPSQPPRPEAVDRSMQSGVQYPSQDIPTPPEDGYDEAEDGLRQEMMSVLLPYLQASSEGAPGSVEGDGREFHENNVIVEGEPTDRTSSMSISSHDEPLFSKRFNKRLNMNAPPEEPINPQDLEGRNDSSRILPSQLFGNVTVESVAHLVTTVTPQQGGVLRSTHYPTWSQHAPLDNSMGVGNSETEGNVGHDALFPYGGQGFSQVPHTIGIAGPEDGRNSQSESMEREAVREEMPPRDLSGYRGMDGMDGISRPERPMFSGHGSAFASFSPPAFTAADFSSSSRENITSPSSSENLGAVFTMITNTIEPALLSNHSFQPEDIFISPEQQPPQTSQIDSSQDLSRSTGMPLLPQSADEVPWSTRFDSALPSSNHDLPSGPDGDRDHFPVFQSTTSDSAADADMPVVSDGSNLGSTFVSNDEGNNALGSTPTTLVTTEEITDQFSRQPLFRIASSSARKLTSAASALCGLLFHEIFRHLA